MKSFRLERGGSFESGFQKLVSCLRNLGDKKMGLDCSHKAWHGSYSAFMNWRIKLAEVAGLPPLELMDGFYNSLDSDSVPTLYHGTNIRKPAYGAESRPFLSNLDDRLPISWDCLKPSPLYELLYHSDCDGEIAFHHCESIADALESLIPLLPDEYVGGNIGNWREKTQKFVDGLRTAALAGEPLRFG